MNRKATTIFGATAAVVALGLSACGATTSPTSTASASIRSTASPTAKPSASAGTMLLPVASNPITNTATVSTLAISKAAVEDNTDPATGKAIADRLQITLRNTGTTALSGFEIYYTMTDIVTKASESYYQKLDGLNVAAGATTTIYFDNRAVAGHYAENKFSLYRSSTNEVDFTIEVSATGAKPVTATAVKSKGTGEKVD